jgi:hypothetical protein
MDKDIDNLIDLFDKKLSVKGSKCSVEGNKYEKKIFDIVSKCYNKDNNKKFNTQDINELGGSSAVNDIVCNWNDEKDIPIEIKKEKSPDYMQVSLKYIDKKYVPTTKNKIPDESKEIFLNLIKDKKIFNNKIPPFLIKNITHEEWIKLKKESNDFHDIYFDCENDTIKKLYSAKKCKYIQISNKGLYYLGEDICNFNVPEFICDQECRIRIKVHHKKTTKGFAQLSIMMSCKPKLIKNLTKSQFSLDDINKLPKNLVITPV